jgi:hypothetical protein
MMFWNEPEAWPAYPRHTQEKPAIRLMFSLCLAALTASPALAEDLTPEAWAAAAEPAFAPGSFSAGFVLSAVKDGCFDDEGPMGCKVSADGLHYVTYQGSLSPENILQILALLPIGAAVEVTGDEAGQTDGRVESVFSSLAQP